MQSSVIFIKQLTALLHARTHTHKHEYVKTAYEELHHTYCLSYQYIIDDISSHEAVLFYPAS